MLHGRNGKERQLTEVPNIHAKRRVQCTSLMVLTRMAIRACRFETRLQNAGVKTYPRDKAKHVSLGVNNVERISGQGAVGVRV